MPVEVTRQKANAIRLKTKHTSVKFLDEVYRRNSESEEMVGEEHKRKKYKDIPEETPGRNKIKKGMENTTEMEDITRMFKEMTKKIKEINSKQEKVNEGIEQLLKEKKEMAN